MTEYAEKGLQSIADAVSLTLDYFRLPRADFVDRWLSDKRRELSRQTTPESWRRIVESLNNRAQRDIVTDDRQNTNVLVLAGPGSGKTPGAGAPYRLPHPRQEGGPPVHPCPGLQPARRRADQAAVTRPDRGRCLRNNGADLPRPRHATGGIDLCPFGRTDGWTGPVHLRRHSQGGDKPA